MPPRSAPVKCPAGVAVRGGRHAALDHAQAVAGRVIGVGRDVAVARLAEQPVGVVIVPGDSVNTSLSASHTFADCRNRA